jgi:hypothetical protein
MPRNMLKSLPIARIRRGLAFVHPGCPTPLPALERPDEFQPALRMSVGPSPNGPPAGDWEPVVPCGEPLVTVATA